MRSWRRSVRLTAAAVAGALVLATLAACRIEARLGAGTSRPASLQSIFPPDGAGGLSVTIWVAFQFSDAMGSGMESYVALHEGTLAGPAVAGRWSWSPDRRTLTFAPDAPLRSHTTYVIHMGGGMRGADGIPLDYASCAALGGRSVNGGMMGSGLPGMMGPGWQGGDGGYGMMFTFTTG